MDGSIRFPPKTSRLKKKAKKKERYKPKTPLGAWLLKARRKAVAAGMATLTIDEVLEETKRRRGRSPYEEC